MFKDRVHCTVVIARLIAASSCVSSEIDVFSELRH